MAQTEQSEQEKTASLKIFHNLAIECGQLAAVDEDDNATSKQINLKQTNTLKVILIFIRNNILFLGLTPKYSSSESFRMSPELL